MNDFDKLLDLNASEIDELIEELKAIEDLSLSSDGLGQVDEVIGLFENNLDGLYKKAMIEQVKTRKDIFIEVIEELRDRRIRLERYRKFLQSGADVRVHQNQNYINLNPKEDIKNAIDLEFAIGILIPRIQDDYNVIQEADNEIYELEAIISSKLRQEPPGDVSHERELISILNDNKRMFKSLDRDIPNDLVKTKRIPEQFDDINRLFKTDLDNYHTVWDGETDYQLEEMFVDSYPYGSSQTEGLGGFEADFNSKSGHVVLDIFGLAPFGGFVFDGVNAFWYQQEGDIVNRNWSLFGFIPVVGEFAIAKYGDEVLGILKGLFKYGDDVAEATRVAGKFPQPHLASDLAKVDKITEDMSKFDPTDMSPKNNIPKGNFGEYTTAEKISNGEIEQFKDMDLSSTNDVNNVPSGLNDTSVNKNGLDSLYKNGNPPPDYVVVESKYGSSTLTKNSDGTKQMSDKWVKDHYEDLGISKNSSTGKYLSEVDENGNVVITELDSAGNKIKSTSETIAA